MELTLTAILIAGTLIVVSRLAARVAALERDVTKLHGTWQGLLHSGAMPPADAGTGLGLQSMDDPFAVLGTLPDSVRSTTSGWRLVLVVDPDCTACAALMRSYATDQESIRLRQDYHLVIASRSCELPPAWRDHFTEATTVCGDQLSVLARLVPPAVLMLDPSGTVRGVTEVSGFAELIAFLQDGMARGIGPDPTEAAQPITDGGGHAS